MNVQKTGGIRSRMSRRSAKKRMLIIVNPYAMTVSNRLNSQRRRRATEHLLALVDEWQPRKIDLDMADGRRFVFSCGVGIDATVVKRVDAHPRLKSRADPYYYTWATVSAFYRSYLVNS